LSIYTWGEGFARSPHKYIDSEAIRVIAANDKCIALLDTVLWAAIIASVATILIASVGLIKVVAELNAEVLVVARPASLAIVARTKNKSGRMAWVTATTDSGASQGRRAG
jgi:hypothetical protein